MTLECYVPSDMIASDEPSHIAVAPGQIRSRTIAFHRAPTSHSGIGIATT